MPDTIDPADLHVPFGCATNGRDLIVIAPDQAGWQYTGLNVVQLAAGESRVVELEGYEFAVLPIAGGGCSVEVAGATHQLAGRESVFQRVTDFVYVGCGDDARITAGSAPIELALPMARAERAIDAYRCAAEDVPVETRGAGNSTRQLNNFLAPGVCDAHRLVAVEVLTPAGNWSSWPPHKHDHAGGVAGVGGEAELEEIYWFRIAERGDGDGGAFGMHRTYDLEQKWDISTAVHDRDVFLVPRGYHGPCIASPAHDMYYLNVLAGPEAERSLGFSDDPALAYVRDTWKTMEADRRVPLCTAAGPSADNTSTTRAVASAATGVSS